MLGAWCIFVEQMNVTMICTIIVKDTPPVVFPNPCFLPSSFLSSTVQGSDFRMPWLGGWGAVLCQAWRGKPPEPALKSISKVFPPSALQPGSQSQISSFCRRHPGSLALLSSLAPGAIALKVKFFLTGCLRMLCRPAG